MPLPLFLILFILIQLPLVSLAAGDMADLLPTVSCGTGWKVEGKTASYYRDTLSDRINGEAELYFPYGFDRMVAARYTSEKSPDTGIDVEIYRLGSLLDAFGMYANYRQKEGRSLNVGVESNLSPSQCYLYQGQYFVHIQVTGGSAVLDQEALAHCAKTVASRIPGKTNRPSELLFFDRQEVLKGTERYLPESLLGYNFLNKGILAEATVEGENLQVFLLLGTSVASASAAFDRYRSQLAEVKTEVDGNLVYLRGKDPLYGTVVVLRKSTCLAGALKFTKEKQARDLLKSICK
jgi:hypothetical protein